MSNKNKAAKAAKPTAEKNQPEAPKEAPAFINASALVPSQRAVLIARKTIVKNAGTQPRVSLDMETVAEYAETIRDFRKSNPDTGVPPIPAITVFRSPTGLTILVDGFHRDLAHGEAKEKDISADIIEPSVPDGVDPDTYVTRLAVMYSCGVNAFHGLRRTQKDKRRAVQTLLGDPEWSLWSNNQIAQIANVSEFMVRDMRKTTGAPSTRKSISKKGKVTEIKTDRIGGKGGAAEKPEKEDKPGGDSKGSKTPAKGSAPKGHDADTLAAITKIVAAVSKQGDEKAANTLKQALVADTLENCPAREIRTWAATSAGRIFQIYPLVVTNRFKPSKAFDIIDQVPDIKTNAGAFILLAIAKGGKVVETIEDGGKKWRITVEKI